MEPAGRFFKSVMGKPQSTLGRGSVKVSHRPRACQAGHVPETQGKPTPGQHALLRPPLGHPKSCLPLLRKDAFKLGGGSRAGQRGREDPSKLLLPKNTSHRRWLKPGNKGGGSELKDAPGTGTMHICPVFKRRWAWDATTQKNRQAPSLRC